MFVRVFNNYVREDDAPSAIEEERRLPEKILQDKFGMDSIEWMTGQVFVDSESKAKRYCAAAFKVDEKWHVIDCRWDVRYPPTDVMDWNLVTKEPIPARGALQMLADMDRNQRSKPVPGLRGNYREAANRYGYHFDKDALLLRIYKDKPVDVEMSFNGAAIAELYKPDPVPEKEKTIETWENFHKEVMQAFPARRPTLQECLQKDFSGIVSDCRGEVKRAQVIYDLMMSDLPAAEKSKKCDAIVHRALSALSDSAFYRAYHLDYNLQCLVLATLLRTGSTLYQQYMASSLQNADQLKSIEIVAQNIRTLCRKRMGCGMKRAETFVNMMMTGPDPYMDEKLPLEKWIYSVTSEPISTSGISFKRT